jgi:hypothetical protein
VTKREGLKVGDRVVVLRYGRMRTATVVRRRVEERLAGSTVDIRVALWVDLEGATNWHERNIIVGTNVIKVG